MLARADSGNPRNFLEVASMAAALLSRALEEECLASEAPELFRGDWGRFPGKSRGELGQAIPLVSSFKYRR